MIRCAWCRRSGLLDIQSGGRAVIGIGSGYQKYEFDRYHRKLSEKSEISMEVWDIIEMALREGVIEYNGKHFQIPHSPIAVRPLQQPMPEIYVTGLEPAVVQRTARGGHVPVPHRRLERMPLLRDMHKHVKAQFAAAGVPPERMRLGVQQYVFVTDDKAEALDIAERARAVGRTVDDDAGRRSRALRSFHPGAADPGRAAARNLPRQSRHSAIRIMSPKSSWPRSASSARRISPASCRSARSTAGAPRARCRASPPRWCRSWRRRSACRSSRSIPTACRRPAAMSRPSPEDALQVLAHPHGIEHRGMNVAACPRIADAIEEEGAVRIAIDRLAAGRPPGHRDRVRRDCAKAV